MVAIRLFSPRSIHYHSSPLGHFRLTHKDLLLNMELPPGQFRDVPLSIWRVLLSCPSLSQARSLFHLPHIVDLILADRPDFLNEFISFITHMGYSDLI